MDIFQAIMLGVLQGITEWLPISSQGQVAVAAMRLFGVAAGEALNYAVFLHIGTLIAALAYFRKEVAELIRLRNLPLLKFLAVAVAASAITAVPSYLLIRGITGSGFALMVAIGAFLIATGVLQKAAKARGKADLGLRNGFFLGLGQGFAVLPGISRSGTTTSVLLFEGFPPERAFRISFLLSIPSVLIAEIVFGIVEGFAFEPVALVSIAAAAIAGLLGIRALVGLAKRINFAAFCIGFGAIYIGLAFL